MGPPNPLLVFLLQICPPLFMGQPSVLEKWFGYHAPTPPQVSVPTVSFDPQSSKDSSPHPASDDSPYCVLTQSTVKTQCGGNHRLLLTQISAPLLPNSNGGGRLVSLDASSGCLLLQAAPFLPKSSCLCLCCCRHHHCCPPPSIIGSNTFRRVFSEGRKALVSFFSGRFST